MEQIGLFTSQAWAPQTQKQRRGSPGTERFCSLRLSHLLSPPSSLALAGSLAGHPVSPHQELNPARRVFESLSSIGNTCSSPSSQAKPLYGQAKALFQPFARRFNHTSHGPEELFLRRLHNFYISFHLRSSSSANEKDLNTRPVSDTIQKGAIVAPHILIYSKVSNLYRPARSRWARSQDDSRRRREDRQALPPASGFCKLSKSLDSEGRFGVGCQLPRH